MNKIIIVLSLAVTLAASIVNARESQIPNPGKVSEIISNDIKYFISKDGTLAECDLRNGKFTLTVYPLDGELNIYILPKVNSDLGDRYENKDISFTISGDSAFMKYNNKEAENFVMAEKYSGVLPDKNGDLHYSEIFFSDAVRVIYVLKQNHQTKNGNWYLLKGEPLANDPPDYNTTLFELLEPDNKTGFRCFMRDGNNEKKLILLQGDCSVVKPTEFFIVKED